MKKFTLSLIHLLWLNLAISQENFSGMAEGKTSKQKNGYGFANFFTTTLASDLRLRFDEDGIYSFSAGPIVSKKYEDMARLAVMPGVAFEERGRFYYSYSLLFVSGEISGVKSYLYFKHLRSLNKEDKSIYLVYGELMRVINQNFELGIDIFARESKEKNFLNSNEILLYQDQFNVQARVLYRPKSWKNIFLTSALGITYNNKVGKDPIYIYDFGNSVLPSLSLGIAF